MTAVVLCVITRDRPEGLKRVLDAIERLDVPADAITRTVVVDNGTDGGARRVVEDRCRAGLAVTYHEEPDLGIPFARNRALLAAGDPELVAFLDDDEEPCRDWLAVTLLTMQASGADSVVGPSMPSYPDGTPRWIIDGGFFERQRFRTGERISPSLARTSGVLIRSTSLPSAPVFDTTFRLAGGSDSHLFHRMARAGRHIVWCDEAVMIEHVPRSRCTAWWLVRRHYRIGNTRSALLLRLDHPGTVRRMLRIGRGLLDSASGLSRLLLRLRHGPAERVRHLQRVACGAGLVTGAMGFEYQEYRVVHSS